MTAAADPPRPATRHRHRLVVRYADTDAQGHVYFANYLTFLDEALTDYLVAIGAPPRVLLEEEGCDFVYADAQVTYRGSCTFQDLLDVAIRVERVGRTSLTMRGEVRRAPGDEGGDGVVLAEGRLVQVCVDGRTHRPIEVPARLRAAIEGREQG